MSLIKLIFQNYISGFFVWWYLVNLVEITRSMYFFWWGILESVKLPEMVSNLFIPLYQDESSLGKILSFFIRLIWIFVGGVITLMFSVVIFIVFVIYLVLPFLPLLILVR
ncbi:MAG: hypothetical protein WCO33_04395 [bacterium]